jgi:hypothetical protein
MRSSQKKEESKEVIKIDKPERARRIVPGSSRNVPGYTIVSNQDEIDRIRKLSQVDCQRNRIRSIMRKFCTY